MPRTDPHEHGRSQGLAQGSQASADHAALQLTSSLASCDQGQHLWRPVLGGQAQCRLTPAGPASRGPPPSGAVSPATGLGSPGTRPAGGQETPRKQRVPIQELRQHGSNSKACRWSEWEEATCALPLPCRPLRPAWDAPSPWGPGARCQVWAACRGSGWIDTRVRKSGDGSGANTEPHDSLAPPRWWLQGAP